MAFSLALGVDTQRLKAKADEISADVENMNKDMSRMINEIIGTSLYWKGDAATSQREKLTQKIEIMTSVIERLRTYSPRILEMAGIYQTTENNNVETAATMKTDIAMR